MGMDQGASGSEKPRKGYATLAKCAITANSVPTAVLCSCGGLTASPAGVLPSHFASVTPGDLPAT